MLLLLVPPTISNSAPRSLFRGVGVLLSTSFSEVLLLL
nr:MAG TPA: hypothetical protein [Caudoviricetes sp.]